MFFNREHCHIKVYSKGESTVKGSPWICATCGEQGFEERDQEYKELLKKYGKS